MLAAKKSRFFQRIFYFSTEKNIFLKTLLTDVVAMSVVDLVMGLI